MNLQDIRAQFVKDSGRFDLVQWVDFEDAYLDNGADYFIKAGLTWLDDHSEHQQTEAIFEGSINAGDYLLKVTNVRAVEKVWTEDPSGTSVKEVEKSPSLEVLEEYGKPPFTHIDRTRPIYYAITPFRLLDADKANISRLERHIYLLPPADKDYTVKVQGDFYSGELVDGTDVNWWTLKYPHTVVQAALMMMERHYRNSEGVNDHLQNILTDLQGIDFNLAAEESAGVDQMNNAW